MEKNDLGFRVLAYIVSFYLMTVCCAGVYFNYEFAKEHGFTSWLLLGEIVPTMKATVWPYFALRHHENGTNSLAKPLSTAQIARMELTKMSDALNASQQATLLINSGRTESDIHHYTSIEKIVEYRRFAQTSARKASADVLNSIYPELGTRFKTDFLGFLDAFLRGYDLNSDDMVKQADVMNDRWADWYQAHSKGIQAGADKALSY